MNRVLVAHASAELYGSDRVVAETVRGLCDAGAEPVLTVPEEGPLVDLVRSWGVRVHVMPFPVVRKSLLHPRGALRALREVVAGARGGLRLLRSERPRAVHVNTAVVPLWLLLARLRRIPSVCHVHEAERNASSPARFLLTAPLTLATAVVANSRYTREVIGSTAPRTAARASVVYNGVQKPDVLEPATARAPGGPVRLLYLGRLSRRKGVDVALEAVLRLQRAGANATLDIVGAAFSENLDFERQLRQQASEHLPGVVRFHGYDTAVGDHLDRCDVLLVPSVLPESFGNTAAEGVLAGKPVVASTAGGLVEVLEGCRSARLVPPGDAAALAECLLEVISDLDHLTALAEADATVLAEWLTPLRYRAEITARILEVLS